VADAARFLAHGDRSAVQVERYLKVRGYSSKVVSAALRSLRRIGYVNDDAAARRLAQARMTRRPMGREALAAELRAREFPAGTVARVVEEAFAGTTEEAVAEGILMSVAARYSDLARETRRRAALLSARGFSPDVIESLLGSAGGLAASAGGLGKRPSVTDA
jgi:regulatory protein